MYFHPGEADNRLVRREPPITFRGALQLLGRYERPWVDRLDNLLGGAILAAGVGLIAPPLSPVAPLWSWVDQKNEAAGLLRSGLDLIQSKISKLQGYERVELIAAAHTMIVLAACFDVLREALGPSADRAIALTEAEQEMLVARRWRDRDDDLIGMLYQAEVPMPTGARGFRENSRLIDDWAVGLFNRVGDFLAGLEARPAAIEYDSLACAGQALDRYETYFLGLAAAVPDFWIWAQLDEHAATRTSVQSHLRAILDGQATALSRLEALLATTGPANADRRRDALWRANRMLLEQPIVRWSDTGDMSFPTVEECYVNPTCRVAVAGSTARPADESWWEGRLIQPAIDLMLTAHVTSFDAVRRPLLIFGHPGGGKSMLTKVLAARLPAESYTVARVPLRQVGANAPIHEQIRQAIDLSTHGRARDWFELVDDDGDRIRVVLLDGLDELLQATTHDRSGFLQEVVEFQRAEAAQDRPVIVVVTSRTVVAERVDIPAGTPIAKLEEFDDAQIGQWLETWNRSNPRARRLTLRDVLAYPELARQPLLLLMLAIYRTGIEASTETAGLPLTELYQRLLTRFAVREVSKQPAAPQRGPALDEAVAHQLYRLSVAAVGMFNRGRQDITEDELGGDLAALEYAGAVTSDRHVLGQRVLGEFFFVHSAEARLRLEPGSVRRCYEFLHATFGEYLIASLVVGELAGVADASLGGSRGAREPDDDLLHALLSHRTMAARRPILDFAADLLTEMAEQERARIARTLETLIQRYDRRAEARRYPHYRPLRESNLRSLAAYSANLVLLRTMLDDQVPLAALCPPDEAPTARWRATVTLWRAGLDADGWQATLDVVDRRGDEIRRRHEVPPPPNFGDIQYARLVGDERAELRLRIGAAFHGHQLYYMEGDNWAEMMTSWLVAAMLLPADSQPGFILAEPPDGTSPADVAAVLNLLSAALARQAWYWSRDFVRLLVQWASQTFGSDALDPFALAVVCAAQPGLAQLVGSPFADAAARWLAAEPGTEASEPGERAHIVRRCAMALEHVPLPPETGYSNYTSTTRVERMHFGSVIGSAAEGQTWGSDGSLPQVLH